MFNPDFYPTSDPVISQMCSGVQLEGRIILEPSAGKGNIVDYLKRYGANVLACEKDPDLATIVATKCRLLKSDFLQVTTEEISHVDCIIMNPPFSADEKHILHAWAVAPEGCEIIALCNSQTLVNDYTRDRKKLGEIVDSFGNSQNLGEAFATAERKTEVQITLIHLFKPRVSAETEFQGYFEMSEDEEQQENSLMPYDEIRNIVNRYVGAVKMFDSVIDASDTMNTLISPISAGLNISFGAHSTGRNSSTSIDRDTFKKELQKSSWHSVFNKMKMGKYVTQKIIGELNSFVEKQTNVPFTVTNVYKMIEMIAGTHKSRMDGVLVEAFEKICDFAHSNNTAGEGWKTNSDYKINRRFIHPYICKYDNRWPAENVEIQYASSNNFDDIVKALCFLTGKDFEDQTRLDSFFSYKNKCEWGKWYDWGFFLVRGYKKGTMHFEFIDEKVWEQFNLRVAEIKGWAIPRKTDAKHKGTERVKEYGMMIF